MIPVAGLLMVVAFGRLLASERWSQLDPVRTRWRRFQPRVTVYVRAAPGTYVYLFARRAGSYTHGIERGRADPAASIATAAAALKRRLIVAVALTVPVVVVAMISPLHFTGWEWLHRRPGDAGRPLVRLAVPPGGAPEPAAPVGVDGHADLDRDTGRLELVDGRPARDA